MARTVRDANLETRTARARLTPRGKPYYRSLEPGLHLGFRKPTTGGAGKWVTRHYSGGQAYVVATLATADDFSDADGTAILSYGQAVNAARKRMVSHAKGAGLDSPPEPSGPYTVGRAMDDYFRFLESDGRPVEAIDDAKYRDRAFIRPKLGAAEVSRLTAGELTKWRNDLARAAPRLRSRKDEAQKHRPIDEGDEAKRKRRATANRTWTVLRAALNKAFEADKVASDIAWRKVKPFRKVDSARVRYLTADEARRLVNASDPDFRPVLHAALLTGARYGQIARLLVDDFNADVGTVRLRSRKGDGSIKVHHAHLTAEGVKFFEHHCAGRAPDAPLFTKSDGTLWGKSHQVRPIEEASERARIKPPANFHVTRHTYGSLAIMNGTPPMVVAQNFGHADTRMVEKHYGHLSPSFKADAIRAGAPKFGVRLGNKVASIARAAR